MKRKLAALSLVLLCASAYGQSSVSNPPPSSETPPKENTLDSARRDVKELPAAERSRDLLAKPGLIGGAGIPTLDLPGTSTSRPDPNRVQSATWLQDSINRIDAEAAARRRTNDSNQNRGQPDRPAGYKPLEAPNPLGQFLGQWMSPRDLELWRAGQASKSGADLSDTFKPVEPTPAANTMGYFGGNDALSDLQAAPTGQRPVVPTNGSMRNPYIEEPTPQPDRFGPAPTTAQSITVQTPADNAAVRGLLAPDTNTAPATAQQPANLKPAAAPVAPPQRPPTAPIVDDRKYFPQLRRF